ncbi:hypothetical protein ESZ50_04685 [Weissella muntiaci]|uniref:Cyanophage baseplate Pam3 plug gp18 domain-containing protein n=1 Tax=Weissella muntiaci TaxID=2508881 RepID=A0A6C2C787_9LACO|nr:hypothetical protein [Weissella muntiaci]TYC49891.1 hypothetical protein ESZ50_04685 [Weissella muntiaci]
MSLRPYIPIEKDNLPEKFEFPFGIQTFIFGINYNSSEGYFTVDLYKADGTALVIGEKMVANQPLWSDVINPDMPAERIIPMDESDPTTDITFDNFGTNVRLYIDNLEEVND